ncbi:MAG: hypothetical protein IJC99_05190 [Clostridia bacterium]|nr:hypothetical protein [Clostridia bacterium]
MRFNRIFLLLFLTLALALGGCEDNTKVDAPQQLPTANEYDGAQDAPSAPIKVENNSEFLSSVVFVGDSTTAHMASRAAIAPTQVWATKSRFLNLSPRVTDERIVLPETGAEMTIAEAAAAVKPPILVVTLGVDYGVYYYRDAPDKFAFYYEKLLDAITAASPDTTLVLQSIFPVGRESKVITNDMVDAANRVVAQIAATRGLTYLDANTLLKDEGGYLKAAFCSSADGIHLTAAAYEVILSNLACHEAEIKGQTA